MSVCACDGVCVFRCVRANNEIFLVCRLSWEQTAGGAETSAKRSLRTIGLKLKELALGPGPAVAVGVADGASLLIGAKHYCCRRWSHT